VAPARATARGEGGAGGTSRPYVTGRVRAPRRARRWLGHHPGMDPTPQDVLGHPVPVALPPDAGGRVAAASLGPDGRQSRLAWVVPARGEVVARVSCPPGVVSRWRPVVATEVLLDVPDAAPDRVLVARAADGVAAVRPLLAREGGEDPVPVGSGGLALLRLPPDVPLDAVDALDPRGEPVGRLTSTGIATLRTDGVTVGGHLGAGHGMGAGIGHGHWAADLAAAAFEAGYTPVLPGWTPPGLVLGRPRVEPELSYPAAPPAVILVWAAESGGRVLLRQAPAPLASPDPGGRLAQPVDVAGVPGVLRGRGLVTLVWERDDRAFGLQVRGLPDAVDVALRVARSVR